MCVATMSLCMIVLIVTRKRGDGIYYFALWQTNSNTPNKLLLSESAVSCLLRVRSVSFTSRAKGCIKFVPHSCLMSLSHEVGVFLEEAICYFIYGKFVIMSLKVVHQYGCFESCQFRPRSVFFVSWRLNNRNYPENNLVCIRRINNTTFHMSITRKFDKVIS